MQHNGKSKAGQISDTITWMVAFVIIFFIIILFLAATNYFSNSRSASSMEFINYSVGTFSLSREFSSFMNSGNSQWKVYDYLGSNGFDNSIFNKYLKSYFGEKSDCYVFCFSSQENKKILSYWNDACGIPHSYGRGGFAAIDNFADFCEYPKYNTLVVMSKLGNKNVYLFRGLRK
jgi:hypothetical protein